MSDKRNYSLLGMSAVLGLGRFTSGEMPAAADHPSHAKAWGRRNKHAASATITGAVMTNAAATTIAGRLGFPPCDSLAGSAGGAFLLRPDLPAEPEVGVVGPSIAGNAGIGNASRSTPPSAEPQL